MQTTPPVKIPYLRSDAIVPVEIGSGFVERLQKAMLYLRAGKTEEDMTDFKRRSEAREPLHDWMEHLATLTGLYNAIAIAARTMGAVEYREISLPDSQQVPRSQ